MPKTCQYCSNYKPQYAPFVKHGFPFVMTCVKNADDKIEKGTCPFWQSKKGDK